MKLSEQITLPRCGSRFVTMEDRNILKTKETAMRVMTNAQRMSGAADRDDICDRRFGATFVYPAKANRPSSRRRTRRRPYVGGRAKQVRPGKPPPLNGRRYRPPRRALPALARVARRGCCRRRSLVGTLARVRRRAQLLHAARAAARMRRNRNSSSKLRHSNRMRA
jgi:hypothetical protein